MNNVVNGLDLVDGNFILSVTWVIQESKFMHMQIPWLLGGDEMFCTNTEKHPLAQLCRMNTNKEILLFMNAFIPSAQKLVCYFLWTGTYPQLLDSDSLRLTKLILVDQNKNN